MGDGSSPEFAYGGVGGLGNRLGNKRKLGNKLGNKPRKIGRPHREVRFLIYHPLLYVLAAG